jgi:L-malate glycosyltransferase
VQLVRLLRENTRYRVLVACLNREGPLLGEAEQLAVGEIPEYPLNSFYDRQALAQLRRFAKHLKEQSVSIVQTHDFYTNVFGIAGAALARVPARIAARRETEGFRSEMQRRVERCVYRLAHAVVANAEAVRDRLLTEGVSAGKIVTIHNGLDLQRVTQRSSLPREGVLASFGLPQEQDMRFVMIVANLRHPVKDHPTFLRAARRVRKSVPEAHFVLAGEGELLDSMRSLANDLGLGQAAFFVGRCQRVPELLGVSDVCVLSSKAEGLSNSILEYMAASRPVVATDVGGAREMITEGETGFLVPAGDDERLAERIITLLRDPELARGMGARGRRVVEERFSCEAQLERTLRLYDGLLPQASATPPVYDGVGM